MLRFADELLPADEIVPAKAKEVSLREKRLAGQLVDELTGPFDPDKLPDAYRSAVLAKVDEKVEAGQVAREEGEEVEAAPPGRAARGAKVIELADLLARSIKAANKPGPAKAAPAAGAPRRPAVRTGGPRAGARRQRAAG
jgi:DNA end-binding protein Ku